MHTYQRFHFTFNKSVVLQKNENAHPAPTPHKLRTR